MKILIRNKKWETSFEKVKLICEVTGKNNIFSIKFSYNGNEVTIKQIIWIIHLNILKIFLIVV